MLLDTEIRTTNNWLTHKIIYESLITNNIYRLFFLGGGNTTCMGEDGTMFEFAKCPTSAGSLSVKRGQIPLLFYIWTLTWVNKNQGRRRRAGRVDNCPLGFGRSANPISTRGGRLCPPLHITTAHPALGSFLRHWKYVDIFFVHCICTTLLTLS